MKRKYVKPAFVVETFAATQSIAQNCTVENNGKLGKALLTSPSSCGWDMGNIVIFNKGVVDCKMDGSKLDGAYCYNEASGQGSVFHS